MENQGYIKIYRKILDNFIYLDSQAVHLWLHILLKANHSKKEFLFNGKRENLQVGQLIVSRDKISLETNISPSKIYRLLKILEREQLIEQQTNNHFTKITVLKYRKYQEISKPNEQQPEQPVNNQRTTSEQPVNTKKKKKNDNNDNNIINNKGGCGGKKEIDLSFIENENFKPIYKNWIDYRNEIKKPFKSEKSIKANFKELMNLSNNDYSLAEKIINKSIANGWQGLFALKENYYATEKKDVRMEPVYSKNDEVLS